LPLLPIMATACLPACLPACQASERASEESFEDVERQQVLDPGTATP
jgi:hypothetical protein